MSEALFFMLRSVRVFLENIADDSDAVGVDLIIDEVDHVKQKMRFHGWWGRPTSNYFWPFMLDVDGKIDFGSDEDTDPRDRYGFTNLQSKVIDSGRYVEMEESDGTKHNFVIRRVTNLLD